MFLSPFRRWLAIPPRPSHCVHFGDVLAPSACSVCTGRAPSDGRHCNGRNRQRAESETRHPRSRHCFLGSVHSHLASFLDVDVQTQAAAAAAAGKLQQAVSHSLTLTVCTAAAAVNGNEMYERRGEERAEGETCSPLQEQAAPTRAERIEG